MANYKNFEVRHPEWVRMANRWKFAFDFWRGGVHVLEPDREISSARYGNIVDEGADDSSLEPETDPRSGHAFRWFTTPNFSYLWKHERETLNQFRDRSVRIIHFPLFQSVINIFTAGILRTPPKRGDVTPGEPWDTYWYDVDMTGTNVDSFIRQALGLALVFGRVHAITDRPRFDSTAESRLHQISRGDRPYSYLLTPLDLVDYKQDDKGNFLWAVVREDMEDLRGPGEDQEQDVLSQYRVWYPTHWELYIPSADKDKKSEEPFVLAGFDEHPCGRVPISTLWATKDARSAQMACESPLADILDIDRHLLNKLSELDELERVQAFELLWLPDVEGAGVGPVDVSPFSAMTGPPEGAPQYVGPNPAHAVNKLTRVEDIAYMAKQLAGVGRGDAERSKEERSAASMMVESEDKRNQMAWWSAAVSEFDKQLHKDVLAWEGQRGADFPQAEYPTDFDITGTFTRINELVMFGSVDQVKSNKKAMATLIKPLLDRILREHGVAPEAIQEAVSSVDSHAAEEEKYQKEMRNAVQKGKEEAERGQEGKVIPPQAQKKFAKKDKE